MRVEREGTHFIPIHITIETKQEADVIWALFNTPTGDVVRNSDGHLKFNEINDQIYSMFCTFDDVHPTGW